MKFLKFSLILIFVSTIAFADTNSIPPKFRENEFHTMLCPRCGKGLFDSNSHVTTDFETNGLYKVRMYALCEDCWTKLTPQQRLPYYRGLFDYWNNELQVNLPESKWVDISNAVIQGK